MSPALLAEIADVLSRPRIRKRISAEDAQPFLGDVVAQAVMFADPANPPSVCRDPDDDYLVALTLTASADVLASGDDDLLAVEQHHREPEIVVPEGSPRRGGLLDPLEPVFV